MKVGLEERTFVITGAASGIGRAIAEHAVAAGARALLVTDIDADGLSDAVDSLGRKAQIQMCIADLADPGAASKIFGCAKDSFERIDGLVNAAGLTTRASFVDGTAQLWDQLFAVNARAPYLLMQAGISAMLDQGGGGSIVNIQSINAHCGAPDLAIYSATKGALQTLTKNAANAHLKDGIRVNGINLGWTLTEAENKMQTDTLGQDPEWAERAAIDLPLGRLILPADAARMATYLLSPVSDPMTGVSFDLEQIVVGAPC